MQVWPLCVMSVGVKCCDDVLVLSHAGKRLRCVRRLVGLCYREERDSGTFKQ